MCIIMCFEDKLPTLETLKQAEIMNRDGGGISWIKNHQVHWKKGLKADEMFKLIKKEKIKVPCIIHFRIGTVGANNKNLCHPFPITKQVSTSPTGISNSVLFHNGHWGEWKNFTLKMVSRRKIQIPNGEWSDSRALTFCVRHLGKNFLHFLSGQKIAIMTPQGIKKFGSGWSNENKNSYSNESYKKPSYYFSGYNDYTENFESYQHKRFFQACEDIATKQTRIDDTASQQGKHPNASEKDCDYTNYWGLGND